MSKDIFNKVFTSVVMHDSYFRLGLRPNCAGKLGLSPLQKIVASVFQITYGTGEDELEE